MNNKEVLRMELDSVENEIRETENELNGIVIPDNINGKGIIVFKYIRCGKTNCRCMHGGQLHGPYPHLQWWEGKKLKTHYLNRKIYPQFVKEHADFKRAEELKRKLMKLKEKERKLKEKIFE